MATLQPRLSPGSRLEAGRHVIERASGVSTKPIKTRFDAFKKSFTQFEAAETNVGKAAQALQAADSHVAELDAIQDEAVIALAAAMAGDGAPRVNPFKPLGFPAPTNIVDLAYEKEVELVTRLAKAAARGKSAGKGTKAAAAKLEKAAAAVKSALAPAAKARVAYTATIAKREAIGIDLDRAFAKLKRAARVAEDDGAEGLFDALFKVEARTPKKKKTASKPAAAATTAPTNGAPAAAPTTASPT
jgi:hypothetical protein